jgi:hypothetical protein
MDGSEWSFDIVAEDFDDAKRRMAAIGMTGKVDGEIVMKIPAWRGWWIPFWCWLKNKRWA